MFDTDTTRKEAVALMVTLMKQFFAADFDIDQFHDVVDDAHAQIGNELMEELK